MMFTSRKWPPADLLDASNDQVGVEMKELNKRLGRCIDSLCALTGRGSLRVTHFFEGHSSNEPYRIFFADLDTIPGLDAFQQAGEARHWDLASGLSLSNQAGLCSFIKLNGPRTGEVQDPLNPLRMMSTYEWTFVLKRPATHLGSGQKWPNAWLSFFFHPLPVSKQLLTCIWMCKGLVGESLHYGGYCNALWVPIAGSVHLQISTHPPDRRGKMPSAEGEETEKEKENDRRLLELLRCGCPLPCRGGAALCRACV